ncbi:protein CUSTOS isoform X2 [Etheostoma cragini]|uniref:protein CUSTOS isoform X2 n=1 Tax=Etheostoma cragini TaxID=417921 RepID=UPI00155EEE66|nr:protein CUSTOS isoform X2 [Etheostoma cragini]
MTNRLHYPESSAQNRHHRGPMLLIMAAAAKKVVTVDSSSSDDEALKRCREAVWNIRSDKNKDEDSNVQQSKRVVVADHDHDGNELQVTKGFQIHVAKKLGHLLDSSITEMQTETLSCVKSSKCGGSDDDDDGFRLFSTSVLGQTADETPAPVRRRPVPSSSDSDSEMETRLREAAVSLKDLFHTSSQPSTLCTPSAELPCSEKVKKKTKVAEGEENYVKKKKKKRKSNQESEQVDSESSPLNAQRNGENTSEQEHTQVKVKVKRKKKKKRELHTEEEALN